MPTQSKLVTTLMGVIKKYNADTAKASHCSDLIPFVPHAEVVCQGTGAFFTVCRPLLVHVSLMMTLPDAMKMPKLVQMCTHKDGKPMSDDDLMRMEYRTYRVLSEMIAKLI